MDIREYFKDIYNDSQENIKSEVALIKSGKGNIPYIYRGIEFDRSGLGKLEYLLNKDRKASKENFYRATLAREWTYRAYEKKEYEIDDGYVTTYVYESLFDAILSGSKDRMIYMANLFGGRVEAEKDDFLPNVLLGYGLKYVILDEKEKAYEYIHKLEENKDRRGMKQYYEGYRRVYKGLIDRDEKEFNEGLEFMLKKHKSRMKRNARTLEQYFAYDSIALAMIAKERGINITVQHELLPMEYLEPVKISYDQIGLFD